MSQRNDSKKQMQSLWSWPCDMSVTHLGSLTQRRRWTDQFFMVKPKTTKCHSQRHI